MSIEECKNNYFNEESIEKLELNDYLFKIVDEDGKKMISECRFNRIWYKWVNEYSDKTGYKLYSYTKDLRPKTMLLAWK